MSLLSQTASEVSQALKKAPEPPVRRTRFAALAQEVAQTLRQRHAAVDREAEWQRVHSYIADVLKDTHVLYAKLARLEGDFGGEELSRLERISEAVLALGNELSSFSKAFYEGKYDMAQSGAYGESTGEEGGEQHAPTPPLDEEALLEMGGPQLEETLGEEEEQAPEEELLGEQGTAQQAQ